MRFTVGILLFDFLVLSIYLYQYIKPIYLYLSVSTLFSYLHVYILQGVFLNQFLNSTFFVLTYT